MPRSSATAAARDEDPSAGAGAPIGFDTSPASSGWGAHVLRDRRGHYGGVHARSSGAALAGAAAPVAAGGTGSGT